MAVKYLHCGKSVPWLIIVALLLFNKTISSQVIQGPESILNTFKQELNSVKNQDSDTLPLYSKYIKKLVNRGNFIEADSIFNANSLGFLAIQDSSKLINIY